MIIRIIIMITKFIPIALIVITIQVERHLLKDIMQSTKPWIEELMTAGYKVLVIIIVVIVIIQELISSASFRS